MKKEQTILVVDDTEFQRSLLSLQLKNDGYSVVTAENGQKALEYLKSCKHSPCLILSDLFMPKVDGFQLCSKVKDLYPDIPVIILTVSKDEENLRKAFAVGASDFLSKPFTLTEITARVSNVLNLKKAEKKLLKSKREFEEVFNTAAGWMRIIDLNHNVLRVNDAMAKVLGKDKTELEGKKCYEIFPGYNCETFECPIQRMRREKRKFEADVVKHINEKEYNCILSVTPFTGDNGEIIGIVENLKDITQRKQTEQALKESEAKYRSLIDSTNTGYVIIDDHGNILDANRKYVYLAGYKELSEIVGRSVLEWTADYDVVRNKNEISECLKKGSIKGFQVDYVDLKGNITNIEVYAKAVKVNQDIQILALCRDISERKKMDQEIIDLAKFPEEDLNPVFRVTKSGVLIYANPAGKLILEKLSSEDEVSAKWSKLISRATLFDKKKTAKFIVGDRVFMLEIVPIKGSGYFNIYGVDISNIEKAKKTILEIKKRLDTALIGANIGLWDWNIKTGEVFYDDIWCSMLGYKRSELNQHVDTWETMLHSDDKDNAFCELKKHFADNNYEFNIEFRLKTKKGNWKWVLGKGKVSERDSNGVPLRMLGIHLDIDERKRMDNELKKANKQLEEFAFYDSLTGVINRKAFLDIFSKTIKEHKRQDKKLGLLFLDVDRFKNINDLYGHDIGDKVLKYIALIIKSSIRETDFIGRLGGDEFVVCLKDIDSSKAAVFVAEKINQKLHDKVEIDTYKLVLGISIGIAIFPEDGSSAFALMKNSDLAMYKSKKISKNSHYLFNQKLSEELLFEKELDSALENDEYFLNFQKIYDSDINVCCVETLLRWNSPKFGVVFPDKFIPILEKNRKICDVGWWVLRETCKKLSNNNIISHLSINISQVQLEDKGFSDNVIKIIKEYKINPGRLSFEISERNKAVNVDSVKVTIDKLKQFGIGTIVLDDFGAGNSSFLSLVNLPIDVVKIDNYFIRNLSEYKFTENVTALVNHLKYLKLKVVAEGVETEEQFKILKEMGCNYFQGFFFSKPENEL